MNMGIDNRFWEIAAFGERLGTKTRSSISIWQNNKNRGKNARFNLALNCQKRNPFDRLFDAGEHRAGSKVLHHNRLFIIF